MKKILFYNLVAITFLLAFFACNQAEPEIIPSDISNVRAEARSGEVKISWDVPEDLNYEYVKLTYYDHWRKKEVKRLASIHGDSIVVKNMLNRFGEYEFKLQTYSKTDTPNANVHTITKACDPVEAMLQLTDTKPRVIEMTEEMFSTNSKTAASEFLFLIDNDDATAFHSQWNPVMEFPHWIVIDFGEEVDFYSAYFGFKVQNHSKNDYAPKNVKIYGRLKDGDEDSFELLDEFTNETAISALQSYESSAISFLDFYKKHNALPAALKFSVESNNNPEKKFYAIAELTLKGGDAVGIDLEKDPIETLPPPETVARD